MRRCSQTKGRPEGRSGSGGDGGNPRDEGGGDLDDELTVEGEYELEATLAVWPLITKIARDQGAGVVRAENCEVPLVTQDVVGGEFRPTDTGHGLGAHPHAERSHEGRAVGEALVASARCRREVADALEGGRDDAVGAKLRRLGLQRARRAEQDVLAADTQRPAAVDHRDGRGM